MSALRAALPASRIGLWAGARFAPLLDDDPRVDRVLTGVRGLAALRDTRWDVALSTVFPGATSFSGSLVTAWSRATCRVGFHHPQSVDALTHALPTPPGGHAVIRLLELVRPLGIDPEGALEAPAVGGRSVGFPAVGPGGGKRILIHTGGRGDKSWDVDAFRDLAIRLAGRGHDVLVARGPKAPAWSPSPGDPPMRFLPRLDVAGLANALRSVHHFVGCDSGVMHLASAVGTSITALFRTSDPRLYAPVGGTHVVLVLGRRSSDYVTSGGWPSLPEGWAPAIHVAPGEVLGAHPAGQVEWVDTMLARRLGRAAPADGLSTGCGNL